MPTHAKSHGDRSPGEVLTELAVEGTSSFVEAQRALLDLAQQEKDIVLGGVKERVRAFLPAVAMTDLVRRSLDTLIGMQQELLTTASKQTLDWIEPEKRRKRDRAAQLTDWAREGVDIFAKAQKNFMEALAQESARATSGKHEHASELVKKSELKVLAREAGNAFIEAQKRLLDVMGQQMNVNVDAAAEVAKLIATPRLVPMATRAREGVKSFLEPETAFIGSLVKPAKATRVGRSEPKPSRKEVRQKTLAV
jgi:hypothetical protein